MSDERKCGECGGRVPDPRDKCERCQQPICSMFAPVTKGEMPCYHKHRAHCRVSPAELVRVARKQQENLLRIKNLGPLPIDDPAMISAMEEMVHLLFEQRAAMGIDGISPDTWRNHRASKDRIN